MNKARFYLGAIKRLRVGQVVARFRKEHRLDERAILANAPKLAPHRIHIPQTDLAPNYLDRFDIDTLMDGRLSILNEQHEIPLDVWRVSEASHLWNFNLHYFEYAVALAAAYRDSGDLRYYDSFKKLICAWIDGCPYSVGDAWHPYTLSLRLVNWLVCMELFEAPLLSGDEASFKRRVEESMFLQYRHLLANQEKRLLANHYFENLKTLVIFSRLFGEEKEFKKTWDDLLGQLDEQVLPDGVHFERSLMYHKLVLEGLLRVRLAVEQTGFLPSASFDAKIKAMLDAMASLERGMGKTPFFNDSADGVAKDCDHLVAACKSTVGLEADDLRTCFPDAGYYKFYDGGIAVMFDAGEPGPSYMLGHAHCDALSYELSIDGEPVVVNCGTYAYQSELRPYFRSTAAHNTALVNGEEQLECWAEHRVARGYRLLEVRCEGEVAEAAIKLPSGHVHRRSIDLADGLLSVVDIADESVPVDSYVHLLRPDLVEIIPTKGCSVESLEVDCSFMFGVRRKVLACIVSGVGEAAYSLRIKRAC